jgi:hypothetical protein
VITFWYFHCLNLFLKPKTFSSLYCSTALVSRSQSPNPITHLLNMPPHAVRDNSETLFDAGLPGSPKNNNGVMYLNYPRLRTKLDLAKLRLCFLKRCRELKRPPSSLKIKASKLIPSTAFIKSASRAETELVEDAIKCKQNDIDTL